MRHFTIHNVDNKNYSSEVGGRYTSNLPLDAAKKAFSRMLRNNKSKQISFTIEIRETTRNSKHKIYKYELRRVEKIQPLTLNNVVHKYDIFSKNEKQKDTSNRETLKSEQTPKVSKDKSKKYECSKEEKEDKLTSVCCGEFNALNKRTYNSCKKHILTKKKSN